MWAIPRLVVLSVFVALMAPATAGEDEDGVVGIGSAKIITVAPALGLPRAERVRILQARLVDVLSVLRRGDDPGVEIRTENGIPGIYVRGMRFVTVTRSDAALHRTTQEALARVWSRQLDRVLRQVAPSRGR